MNTASFAERQARTTATESDSRLHAQLDFCAHAEDPEIYVRNAWTQSGQGPKTLLVGTAVVLVFGDISLACSLRESPAFGRSLYARLLPTNIALQEDISLEVWPQWQRAGRTSEFFAFNSALKGSPWRWDFQRQNDALIIMPQVQPLTTTLGLQVRCPFPSEPLLELHPCAGNWVASATYLERHPPVYPQHFSDAWGWLLPTALWNFELEGYRFRSSWEYAVNPILLNRTSKKESILERLVRATQHRLAVDDAWGIRAQNHIAAVDLLARQTGMEESRHCYFSALRDLLHQTSRQPSQPIDGNKL